jgi:hypothetical protein
MVDVVVHSGGEIAGHPGVEAAIIAERGVTATSLNVSQRTDLKADVTARSTAIGFLLGCDRMRYGRLIEDLERIFT